MRWIRTGVGLGVGALLLVPGCVPRNDPGCPTCPGTGGSAGAAVLFETLDQGVRSGIRDRRALAIRDGATWTALWAQHIGAAPRGVSPPAVDFAREMVVAYFRGEKPTSGYAAEIREIVLTGDGLRVRVDVSDPPPGAFVLQILTQPFHVARLPRYEGPVTFDELLGDGKEGPA